MKRVFLVLLAVLCVDVAVAGDLKETLKSSFSEKQHGSFTQERTISGLPLALTSKGIFSYGPKQGLHWQTLDPVQSTMLVTDEGLVQDGKHIDAANALSKALLGLFSGDFTMLEEFFSVDLKGVSENWQAELTPLNDNVRNALKSIALSGQSLPAQSKRRSITLIDANGDMTEIFIKIDSLAK